MLITLFTFGFRFVGFVIRTRSNTIALSSHATILMQCLFAHRSNIFVFVFFFFWNWEKNCGPMQIGSFNPYFSPIASKTDVLAPKLLTNCQKPHHNVPPTHVHAHGPIVYVIVWINSLLWKLDALQPAKQFAYT